MTGSNGPPKKREIGQFRFSIVGGILACPPTDDSLITELRRLANIQWLHPVTKEHRTYSVGTIERWFYIARKARDPVDALCSIPRRDRGLSKMVTETVKSLICDQYQRHPDWTKSLHHSNLKVLMDKDPSLGKCPSYSTLRRHMNSEGMKRQPRPKKETPGRQLARDRLNSREVRSFEMEYVSSLWHLDFHHGSRQILNSKGQWEKPICLAIHDDHSRLCCHIQWYLSESCENLVHGLSQAFLKRGLPRSLMTDNGSAMKADEFTQGLSRLGVIHDPCLPYSPYQNGKTERFWAILESRLMPMLPNDKDLDLREFNKFTISWAEMGYNKETNRETGQPPLDRCISSQDVSRPSPNPEALKEAFRGRITRRQRSSDGTVTVHGRRYEIPYAYRHFESLLMHIAKWDPSFVHLVDPDTDKLMARLWPVDNQGNSDGLRRATGNDRLPMPVPDPEAAPLLQKYLEAFAATGMPLPYIPQNETQES